jgi:hypothetical protein
MQGQDVAQMGGFPGQASGRRRGRLGDRCRIHRRTEGAGAGCRAACVVRRTIVAGTARLAAGIVGHLDNVLRMDFRNGGMMLSNGVEDTGSRERQYQQ